MTGCCALHCKNRSDNGFKVYGFPSNPARRKIWERRIGRVDYKGNPWTASRAKICEVHFEEDQFELHRVDGKRKLKWDAIPSIFAKTRAEASQLHKKRDFQPMPFTVRSNLVRNHKDHSYSCDGAPPVLLSVQSVDEISNNTADDHSYGIRTLAGKEKGRVTSRLREKIKEYQFQLRKAREENLKLQKRQSKVREGLSKLFGSDQIQALRRGGSMRGIEWTSETVQKALKLYAACGKKGYSYLLEQHFPLPSIRTLQRHVRGTASTVPGRTLPIQEETEPFPQEDDLTLESISSLLACLASPETGLVDELQT